MILLLVIVTFFLISDLCDRCIYSNQALTTPQCWCHSLGINARDDGRFWSWVDWM